MFFRLEIYLILVAYPIFENTAPFEETYDECPPPSWQIGKTNKHTASPCKEVSYPPEQ